jgi:hypothetical protein
MLKLGKFGLALALALMMSLTLLTSGAFAQSVTAKHSSQVNTAVVTTMPQVAQRTLQTTNAQQVTQKLSWGPCWNWCGGFPHHRFFHHRFFIIASSIIDGNCDEW